MCPNLMTGSRGRLGKVLLEKLNTNVYCYDSEICNLSRFEKALKKVQPKNVFHLAGMTKGTKEELEKVNTKATIDLYRVAKENGVKNFIFASTSAVYRQNEFKPTKENENVDPQSDYGMSKLLAEQGIQGATIFRIFNIYGRNFEKSLVNKVKYSSEEQKIRVIIPHTFFRDYIYCDDVISAMLESINRKPDTYNLGSGKATSTQELIEMFAGHTETEETEQQANISWSDMTKYSDEFTFKPSIEIRTW